MTIGIIPCAGQATRIQKLPKFLLPVPGGYLLKVLHERMVSAGAQQTLVGANVFNWNLLSAYPLSGLTLYEANTPTMSQTVLNARAYLDLDQDILFGMPDTYWTDERVFDRLLAELNGSPVVAIVGLWHVDREQSRKLGMCDVSLGGILLNIEDKPPQTDLHYAWGAIAWRRAFWPYINPLDPHVGFALQRALEAGKIIRAVTFDGQYFDCGTADDYFACIRATTAEVLA